MKLRELNDERQKLLHQKLLFLHEKVIQNAFEDPNIPLLNSTKRGTVDDCSRPAWYTHIQDILEEILIEYTPEDVKNKNFSELKVNVTPETLVIYLFPMNESPLQEPLLALTFPIEIIDLEKGSFRFIA